VDNTIVPSSPEPTQLSPTLTLERPLCGTSSSYAVTEPIQSHSSSPSSTPEDNTTSATGSKRKRTHSEPTHTPSSSKKPYAGPSDLRKWMFKATSEEIAAQRAHVREEFLEEREDDEKRAQAIRSERKMQKTEGDRQRKRDQRARDKEKDIRIGKRDVNGKLRRTKVRSAIIIFVNSSL
jgi:hypothetical protein